MTTKPKKKVSKKGSRKLTLNKETIRDLSAESKADAIRGGIYRRNTQSYQ